MADYCLRNAVFSNVDVSGVSFEDTDLQGADLSSATGLVARQLAGADLCGAKLPEDITWPEIDRVAEMSKNCGQYFVAILAACAFVALTALSATNVQLLADNATAELPIVQVPVSIVTFSGPFQFC